MVKKMISAMGALCALVSSAYAASATVWSAEDGNGTFPPVNGWYAYPDAKATAAEAAGAKATLKTAADNSKVLTLSVSKTNESSAAGMGFAWAKNNGVVSLEDYAGLCLTYTAEVPFRLEFKQSTIKYYDFYGAMIPAATKTKTVFVAFSDLEQEGWGTVKDLDLTKQQALQFGYKQAFVADYGTTNTITISAVWLGSTCEQHAPELGSGYATGDETVLNEGDTLNLDLTKVFVDADEDVLSYTLKIENSKLVMLADSLYNKTKKLNLITKSNPEGSTTVTITATDPTKKSVSYAFTVETVDRENPPVAVNDSYTTKEETKLTKSTSITGVMANDYDPDGDTFTAELVETTAHGTLTFDGKTGGFTYTPEKDFFGVDVFTYQLVETKDTDPMTSKVGTVSITVTNVDDPLIVGIAPGLILSLGEDTYKLGDTLVLAEDFDPVSVTMPLDSLIFVDPDVEGLLTPLVKSSGIVTAKYGTFGNDHVIDLEPVANANGVAKVTMYAVDGKDTASVVFYVKVTPVADPPIAFADTYDVLQDTLNTITAKKGVLANDKNPDNAKSLLTAILLEDASSGTVKLAEDGSFTYDAPEEEGEDMFVYAVVNAEGDTSEPVIVTLNIVYKNKAPTVVKGVADTVGTRLSALVEDFSKTINFTKAEVLSWFTDDTDLPSALKFTARSDDSLLSPVVATNGYLQVKAVKNACGDATVIVVATDTQGATAELKIPAVIACTNDRPLPYKAIDTVYVGAKETLLDTIDLSKIMYDPDGDTLRFTVLTNNATEKLLEWEVKGNILVVKTKTDVTLKAGTSLPLTVIAHDASTDSSSCIVRLITSEAPKTSIKPTIAAAPKASWQSAILANRGAVALFDMQGRVMWKAKLPVSEADVRNAAAQVQGRKILQVNKQTWTIK